MEQVEISNIQGCLWACERWKSYMKSSSSFTTNSALLSPSHAQPETGEERHCMFRSTHRCNLHHPSAESCEVSKAKKAINCGWYSAIIKHSCWMGCYERRECSLSLALGPRCLRDPQRRLSLRVKGTDMVTKVLVKVPDTLRSLSPSDLAASGFLGSLGMRSSPLSMAATRDMEGRASGESCVHKSAIPITLSTCSSMPSPSFSRLSIIATACCFSCSDHACIPIPTQSQHSCTIESNPFHILCINACRG